MQENNNFETIISTWRRLSGEQIKEQIESTALVSMSGDNANHGPIAVQQPSATTTAVAGVAIEPPTDYGLENTEKEKNDFIRYDREDSKAAAGDTLEKEIRDDKSNPDKEDFDLPKKSTSKEEERLVDKVDSVYLRSPPPGKVNSPSPTIVENEESCGQTCLYYLMVCFDCIFM